MLVCREFFVLCVEFLARFLVSNGRGRGEVEVCRGGAELYREAVIVGRPKISLEKSAVDHNTGIENCK